MLSAVIRSLLFILISFRLAGAEAAEFYEPYQSIRQLGMGGVYVFHENDANSFIQNPAFTCHLEGLNWSIFDINLGGGDVNSYRELVDAGGGQVPMPESMGDLAPYFGKNVWFNLGGYTTFTLPCFGMAAYYSGLINFQVHNPAFPVLQTNYLTDYGFNIGGAVKLSPVLSLGIAAKRTTRRGGPYNFGASSITTLAGADALQNLVESIENEGVGYGFDAGLVSRFSMLPFNPTVHLSWRDVGSTAFMKTRGDDAPERQKDNLVAGMTIDGSIPLLGLAAGIEYRHITDTGEQIGKKLHAGAEVSIGPIDARAGFNQGYTTYGIGMNFWLFQLDAAYYKVEKGIYPGQTPDERVKAGILIDLEFDPNFKLVDFGGKKRRLKQRR